MTGNDTPDYDLGIARGRHGRAGADSVIQLFTSPSKLAVAIRCGAPKATVKMSSMWAFSWEKGGKD